MTLNEIRKRYLDFMKANGHAILISTSLIPENDASTLFTSSGMQPLINYLLGATHSSGRRLANSQKCFRSQDIEAVGDNRHTTFFEMLGNWSLGDYFKKEQINFIYKFLTDQELGLGLEKDKLYFTCYAGNQKLNLEKDLESAELWKSLGISEEKIYFYDDKKNWWSRAGAPDKMPIGEIGGPDSEIFFDFDHTGEKKNHQNSKYSEQICHPNCDCGRFMEIGNNVFIQFRKTGDSLEELKQKNVDFGGGLERLAAAKNDDADIFNLDVFTGAKNILEKISGHKYSVNTQVTFAFRVILDHIRAATFLIGDGIRPGNKDQNYFVRRLIRRAIKYARNLNIQKNFTTEIAQTFINYYSGNSQAFLGQNLEINSQIILEELEKEENKFRKTLESGLKEFEKIKNNLKDQEAGQEISGLEIFNLFQTFGFPIELTCELATENNLTVDLEELRKLKLEHAENSRTASQGMFKGGLADSSEITTALHTVTHLMLAGMQKILGQKILQAGSNQNSERTRFDFTFDRKLTDLEIVDIENYVNSAIQDGFLVEMQTMSKQLAKDQGVTGAFWEKYPETVTVYEMKNKISGEIYSRELCGGPHVQTSQDYLQNHKFKILKQEAISGGVRRLKAVLQ